MTTRTTLSPTTPRRARRLAAAGLLGVAATLSLTACQWTSPITTQLQYDAADGKSADLGSVKILNALVVAEKQDGPGTLVASFANRGTDQQTVQVKVGDQTVGTVEVPAGQVVQASTQDKSMQIAKVPAAPGAETTVVFATASGAVTPVNLPVLPPTAPYASFKPTAASTSATTSTASGTATGATAGATASPTTASGSTGSSSAAPAASGSATPTASPSS